jgi:hypothetical protein
MNFGKLTLLVLTCASLSLSWPPAAASVLNLIRQPGWSAERCGSSQPSDKLGCYLTPTAAPTPQTTAMGAWRLVRTPNPAGGRDAVSIMRTADLTKSDLDFAGLMLRCGETATEVMLVLVRPVRPRSHPKITLTVNADRWDFTSSVVPPGEALLLPAEASVLAAGPWQSAPELAITVDDEQGPIRGVVPLAGLGAAFRTLVSNCPAPGPTGIVR